MCSGPAFETNSSKTYAQIHGEAYHAWHHVHPRAYHRPGIDATYWLFILPGILLGLFEGSNILAETKAGKISEIKVPLAVERDGKLEW